MKEYINRTAAMESILGLTIADPAVAQYADAVYYNLQRLPAADVTPVRHGHWINIPPYQCEAGYKKGQQCSECYAYYVSDGTAPWSNHRYCAECGAKMDGEVEWESEQP